MDQLGDRSQQRLVRAEHPPLQDFVERPAGLGAVLEDAEAALAGNDDRELANMIERTGGWTRRRRRGTSRERHREDQEDGNGTHRQPAALI